MPSNANPLSAAFQKVKGTLERLNYILKLVWDTNRFLLIGMVFISILEGVLPLLHAFITSSLINALVNVFGAQTFDSLKPVISLLILQFLYLIISRTSTQFKNTLTRLAGEMVASHIKIQIANNGFIL